MGRADKPQQETAVQREDFLERWSRRKLAARQGGEVDVVGESTATHEDVAPADGESEKVLTDVDMPPVETLDADSDYSPFLSPGVSDDLRQQAMRKLFAQPDFNITDGLNDYDEDYTQFGGLGTLVTHEMKRMLQRELEREDEAADSTHAQAGQAAGSADPANDMTATGQAAEGEDDATNTGAAAGDTGRRDITPG